MFGAPFFDFFDTIDNEVENVHRILGHPRYRDIAPRRQLTSGDDGHSGKIQKRPHRSHSNQNLLSTKLNKWFNDDWALSGFEFSPSNITPPVDLFDHEKNYDVRITVPGVEDSKSINLEYHKDGNEIVVSGEVPSTVTEHNRDNVKVKEVASGQFKRVITLPESPGVNVDKIKADYKNGVLTLHVPKLEQTKKENVRKIEVASSED